MLERYILRSSVGRMSFSKVKSIIEPDGQIITAHCQCMAGLGEVCSHVGAVLFKLEACTSLGYNTVFCTSKPCAWIKVLLRKCHHRR